MSVQHSTPSNLVPCARRFALERATSAQEAIGIIGDQADKLNDVDVTRSQQCYVIADEKEVWLLNVAGKLWAAERIADGFRAIGAGFSVSGTPALTSPELKEKALDLGLWNGEVCNVNEV